MLFSYTAVDNQGNEKSGTIDAYNESVAISSLQRRGLVISAIHAEDEASSLLTMNISFLEGVSNKEVVILSRQISTLFEAQVSALRVFRLLAEEAANPVLQRALTEVADDIQSGSSMSVALQKHPRVFTPFYVNMVHAGEESGKLDETFSYLADYLDRIYEVSSKARNALIYPAFIITVFIIVMMLMITLVIPRVSTILIESGQEIPVYTQVVIGISNFFITYGYVLLGILVLAGVFLWRYSRSPQGKLSLDQMKMQIPFAGNLYRKLYLSRISDNMSTMLTSGIPVVQATEITASVVGNAVYEDIMNNVTNDLKSGSSIADSMVGYEEIPRIMIAMIRVGEETGELGNILQTLAKFYEREVVNEVDTLVTLIEPIMIVLLGLGVGVLLASVLIPIYNISSSI